jgi:nitroreductase
MTGDTDALRIDRDAALQAIGLAVRAPSIHNTQPWRWRLDEDALTLLADRTRQLAVADPDGHSMLISCGAALHLTELGLQVAGWQIETELSPDPADPDVLARFRAVGRTEPVADVEARTAAAFRRRSDRRPFNTEKLSAELLDALRGASSDEFAWTDFPTHEDERINLAVAVSWADRVERDDQAYVAEMARWLRDPDVHANVDGVLLDAVPHVPADQPRHTDVPLRDFEVGMSGRQLIERDVDEQPMIAVILTRFDNHSNHLRAGQAMMRLMIDAELRGLSSCALSQAVDFAAFRTRVQGLMGWVGYPQIMLRVGYPGMPGDTPSRTPRRDAAAVLDFS